MHGHLNDIKGLIRPSTFGRMFLISLFNLVCAYVHAHSFNHVWLSAAPWTVAHPALLSMGFLIQEYWSWLPFPSPGDLPDPGIKPISLVSPALADRFFATQPPEKAPFSLGRSQKKIQSGSEYQIHISLVRSGLPSWLSVHKNFWGSTLGLRNSLPRALSSAFDLKMLTYSLRWSHF